MRGLHLPSIAILAGMSALAQASAQTHTTGVRLGGGGRVQADDWKVKPERNPWTSRPYSARRRDGLTAAERRRRYQKTDHYGRPLYQPGDKLARKARKGTVGNNGKLK